MEATAVIDDFTKDELESCRVFIKNITSYGNVENNNEPSNFINPEREFESYSFCLTKEEINGEVIDILHRYLHLKNCPDVLTAPLVCFVEKQFMEKDFKAFELERNKGDGNDVIEYNAGTLTKELYKVFITSCQMFLQNFEAQTLKKNGQKCHISVHAVRNRRRKMEDRHVYYTDLNSLFGFKEAPFGQSFYAVFDGHGGTDAANYAASQLVQNIKLNANLMENPGLALREAIIQTDAEFCKKAKRERLRSGATAVVALIQGTSLTVAWLGDSQIVLCKDSKTFLLTEPHKPDRPDERERIETAGGCVVFFGGWRVNGSLAVSRAIGDHEQKPFISGIPDVEEYEMEGDEEFLILACDGLWDCVPPDDAVSLVCQCVREKDRDNSAFKLVELAKEQKSMDNISVLVVFFDFNKENSATVSKAFDNGESAELSNSTNEISQTVLLTNINDEIKGLSVNGATKGIKINGNVEEKQKQNTNENDSKIDDEETTIGGQQCESPSKITNGNDKDAIGSKVTSDDQDNEKLENCTAGLSTS